MENLSLLIISIVVKLCLGLNDQNLPSGELNSRPQYKNETNVDHTKDVVKEKGLRDDVVYGRMRRNYGGNEALNQSNHLINQSITHHNPPIHQSLKRKRKSKVKSGRDGLSRSRILRILKQRRLHLKKQRLYHLQHPRLHHLYYSNPPYYTNSHNLRHHYPFHHPHRPNYFNSFQNNRHLNRKHFEENKKSKKYVSNLERKNTKRTKMESRGRRLHGRKRWLWRRWLKMMILRRKRNKHLKKRGSQYKHPYSRNIIKNRKDVHRNNRNYKNRNNIGRNKNGFKSRRGSKKIGRKRKGAAYEPRRFEVNVDNAGRKWQNGRERKEGGKSNNGFKQCGELYFLN